jgi:FAD/FMN-containing dehydrogenase
VAFGHFGDGNLHYNIAPPAGPRGEAQDAAFLAQEQPVNRLVHDIVMSFDGSISAEYGLGVLRRDEAARYKSGVELELLRTLKNALDPQHIMNPNKVLTA